MGIFKKNKQYFTLPPQEDTDRSAEAAASAPSIPEGLWTKCVKCDKFIITDDLEKNHGVCPKCGAYHRLGAHARISLIVDKDTFREINENIVGNDPLGFPGYENKLESSRKNSGLKEAVITGYGNIEGIRTAIGVMEPGFMMGSMGTAVGEKLASLIEFAIFYKLPLVIFSASGGARMQEGIMSLMQMAKVSAVLKRHSDEGLLYVSVPTDPTTGGVTASFAMLGDIIIAEPGTLIGFAGRRVIEGTIRQKLPEDFQSAEFLLEHGFLDAIVKREDLKDYLHRLLMIHRRN